MIRHLARIVRGPLLLTVLVSPAIPAAGAAGLPRHVSDVTTIQWWNDDWGIFDAPVRSIGDLFTKSHPTIKIAWLFDSNHITKLETAIAAGAPPDCAEVNTYSGELGRFISTGSLLPLDTYFQQAHISLSSMVPSIGAMATSNGHIYGLPGDADANALYYNKDMFRKVGLDPNKPPRTLAESAADAAKFYKVVNGRAVSIGADFTNDNFILDALRFGGTFYDSVHHKITAADPHNVAAMTWLAQWNKQFDVTIVSKFTGSQPGEWSAGNPFATGHEAFLIDGWWGLYPMNLYAKNVDYGVVAIPSVNGTLAEQRHYPLMGWVTVIPKGSQHPDACWQFMKWTYYQHSDLFAVKTLDGPTVINQFPSFWNMVKQTYPHDRMTPYLPVFDQGYRTYQGYFPQTPVAGQYYDALQRAMQQVIHGQKAPRQALLEVQKKIQADLDQYMATHHNQT